MALDVSFLSKIISHHLKPDSFEHCIYVQNQIRWFERRDFKHEQLTKLKAQFVNHTYKIFLTLDWDRIRDKEYFEFSNSQEYDKLKEKEIRNSFQFQNAREVSDFFIEYKAIKPKTKNFWNLTKALDIVIDETSKLNFDLALYLLEIVIKENNSVDYFPWLFLKSNLNDLNKIEKIWALLDRYDFIQKTRWKLTFFELLREDFICSQHFSQIIAAIKDCRESILIIVDGLEKYLKHFPELYESILMTVKNANDKLNLRITLWESIFTKYFNNLGENIELIGSSYVQQVELQQHYDYNNEGFKRIFEKDNKFLIKYITKAIGKNEYGMGIYDRKFNFIWEFDGAEALMTKVFDLLTAHYTYYALHDDLYKSFFQDILYTSTVRADNFLFTYLENNIKDTTKVNIIVQIVRETRPNLYEDVILKFLDLNQDVSDFSDIWWRGNGGMYSGDIIISDVEAADWKNILSIVEKSPKGISLIPIKKYINDQISSNLQQGDWERKLRFIGRR